MLGVLSARDASRADDRVVVVENNRLARGDAVCGLLEHEREAALRLLDLRGNGRRAVAPLGFAAVDGHIQATSSGDRADGKSRSRPDEDRVRAGVAPMRIWRLGSHRPEPASLPRREPPRAFVTAESPSILVHDRSRGSLDAVALQELSVIAAAEEARLLTLGAGRDGEPRLRRLATRRRLCLLAEREPESREQPRVETGEHVGLVLLGIGRAREQWPTFE